MFSVLRKLTAGGIKVISRETLHPAEMNVFAGIRA